MTNSETDCRPDAATAERSGCSLSAAGGVKVEDGWALFDELRRTERRGAVARIAAVLAHSIGTPLNVISGRAALICSNEGATDAVVSDASCIVSKVDELARRLRSYVDVLSCSELPTPRLSVPATVDPRSVLVEALELYEPVARFRNIALHLGACTMAVGQVNRGALLVILTSLLSYATRGSPPGTTIEVALENPEIRPVELLDAEYVRIVLNAPGCRFFDCTALERCELTSLREPIAVEGMQVAMVCSALSRSSGGKIEIDEKCQGEGRVAIYWPFVDAGRST
jgi:signal transduction histidine kinase